MGEFQGKSHCWPKRTQRLVSHLPKKYLDYPQDFEANILWTDETKVELFGRCMSRYIWCNTSTAFHQKTSYQQSNMVVVVVWWSGLLCIFRTWTTCHTSMEPWILPSIRKSWRRMSGHQFDLKLKSPWVMQEDNDSKHTSKSNSIKNELRFWSGQIKV